MGTFSTKKGAPTGGTPPHQSQSSSPPISAARTDLSRLGRSCTQYLSTSSYSAADNTRDASGNVRYEDIGIFLRDRIRDHFAEREIESNLKYLDPSYLIRSVPANAWDRILSDRMARSAVHAAMAGRTDVMIGFWHNTMIHVPIGTAVAEKRHMEISSDMWNAVLSTTGQPRW